MPRSVPGPHTVEYFGERFLERIFYADAKYIEMKRCLIMQIGVCCIRRIAVDIELFWTRIALSGPHIALRGPELGSEGPHNLYSSWAPNLYFNH